ncbi:MAG: UvrD-helicase domain-containing protein [Magnetococcales bacterium]|nr:UvrD-helicase domain-containing protein [Magnetococcales bacterium]
MSDRLHDAQIRREALDPRRSFIVQAPAGSGKTGLLTQRYLRLLAGVERPEEVVAITFTRKAAAEMRHRILEALERAAVPDAPAAEPDRSTWRLAREVLDRDRVRAWSLTHTPSRLRILTIDALCAAIARQMPVTSGLGVDPELCDAPIPLYRRAAREVLGHLGGDNRWSRPVARLLDHLDNRIDRAETLLAGLLARRDQWLRHLAGGAPDRVALEGALATVIDGRLQRLAARFPPAARRHLPALAAFAAAHLPPEAGDDHPLLAWRNQERFPDPLAADLPLWRGLRALLLTGRDTWRARLDKNLGFPPSAKAEKQAFKALLDELQIQESLDVAIAQVGWLPDPDYGAERWAILEALARLLPLAAATLRVIFAETGQVDHAEVALRALQGLGQPDAPTDLALTLDGALWHLLVDEFQDTSQGQFRLLARLTAGWSPGDGRSLFLVGDPMQSIYRFREAEVGLFQRVVDQGLGSLRPEFLTLAVNFRSDGALVAWVNDLFGDLAPRGGDALTGAAPAVRAVPFHPAASGDPVAVHGFAAGREDQEAAAVARLAGAALAADPAASVAILVRARGHLARVIPELRAARMPFQAVEIAGLADRPVVRDLIALTRALIHPADRVSWLAVLRAPWCGLTLADLHVLAADGGAVPLWDRLLQSSPALSADGAARVERLVGVLGPLLAADRRVGFDQGSGSLRRRVEGAWLALGGPATLAEPGDLDDAATCLELVESLERGGTLTDFRLLEEGLAGLRAAGVDVGARLQIMTIHKAKGLEFDTVILPGLGRSTRGGEAPLLRWLELAEAAPGQELLLGTLQRLDRREPDPIHAFLGALDREKETLEAVRLLYVAVTRARRRLVLTGCGGAEVQPRRGSLLGLLWSRVAQAFPEPVAAEDAAPAELPVAPPPLLRFPAAWRPPAPAAGLEPLSMAEEGPAAAIPFDWAGATVRAVGRVTHRWLQRMAREGAAAWSAERVTASRELCAAQLAGEGVPEEELAAAVAQVRAALNNCLVDDRGRWLLFEDHPEAATELALTGVSGGRLVRVVLDRTFVDRQGQRWIVDYKTGLHLGGDREGFLDNEVARYRGQLESYAALLATRERRPIRLGLYFPLLPGWREWPYAG